MVVSRAGLLAAAAAGALSAGCGGGGGLDPRACSEGCAITARCLGGSCVEDGAPEAVLLAPASARARALVELDGSASADPDAALGDHVAGHRWTLTGLAAACAAPAVASTGATARVRFDCAGEFRVQLVVVDDLGKESVPVTADVAVDAPGPSPVVAGADRTVNHVCSGAPRTCTTDGTAPVVTASLAPGTALSGAVAYHWSADPPRGVPLDEHRRVTFSPSADVAEPTVHIDVDSVALPAIVDDWVLRVSARDDAGPLGDATTRVSVTNRPPALVDAVPALSVGHVYSAGAYRATARTSRWQDPDGDPIWLAAETGSGICSTVSFADDGTAVVGCFRAFAGSPGLSGFAATHALSIQPQDPWQAAVPSPTAITILNRPVSATSSTAAGALDCQEGAGCCRWEDPHTCGIPEYACAEQSVLLHPDLSDPDGDPLEVTWAGGGFLAQSLVCEPAACTGTTTSIPASAGCSQPHGSRTGAFSASDGLSSAAATLTFEY
jgi:hypothetical protein